MKKFKSKLGSDDNKLEGSSNIDKNIFESLLVRDIDHIPSSPWSSDSNVEFTYLFEILKYNFNKFSIRIEFRLIT